MKTHYVRITLQTLPGKDDMVLHTVDKQITDVELKLLRATRGVNAVKIISPGPDIERDETLEMYRLARDYGHQSATYEGVPTGLQMVLKAFPTADMSGFEQWLSEQREAEAELRFEELRKREEKFNRDYASGQMQTAQQMLATEPTVAPVPDAMSIIDQVVAQRTGGLRPATAEELE